MISAEQENFSCIIPTREQTGGSNRLFLLLFIIYFKEFGLHHPAARLPLSYSASAHMGTNHTAGAGDAAASRRSPPKLRLSCGKGNKERFPPQEVSLLITWHIHLIQPGSFQVVSDSGRHGLNADPVCLPRQSKEKPSHNHFQTLKWLHCHYS